MHKLIKSENIIIALFIVLSIIGIELSELSIFFVADQVINRFIRNGLMVLALIIPIKAGMGLNFSITVGAMITQGVIVSLLALGIIDGYSIILIIVLNIALSIVFGYIIGIILNKVKGKEMITGIIIGFLANSIYQMIFMVGFGTLIKVKNQEILLSRGIGVRNMVDLFYLRNSFESVWNIKIFDINIPIFMIMVVLIFAMAINYIMNTRFGQKVRALGIDKDKAEIVGIDGDKIRVRAIIISTVLASMGQLLYVQNIGMLNVYTGHLKTDIFSCAALLAGGASIKKASVRNALLGIILFHTLFIVSPQAGQNFFNNSSLGEYFRTFIAYGTIAFALVFNIWNEEEILESRG